MSEKTAEFRNPEYRYLMKETVTEKEKPSIERAQNSYLTSLGFELFALLRARRFEIAQENAIPPYVVFSDKTLVDMCVKLPANKEQMLNVSGVAEIKYQKYGQRFLSVITEFTANHPGRTISEYYITRGSEPADYTSLKAKKRKRPFYLNADDIDKVEYSEYAFISEIRDRLNAACSAENAKKLTYEELNQFLIDNGYIEFTEDDGQRKKAPTEKGRDAGIIEVERYSEHTNQAYKLVQYPINIQKELVYFIYHKNN